MARAAGYDEDDDDDINKPAVPKLKILCQACGVTLGRRKQDLITQLVPCLEGIEALASDGKGINERYDEFVEAVEKM